MIRPQMDWRRLMNHFTLRYMCLLRKYGEAPQSGTTTCVIIDDTVLEKSGVRMEGVSRVFDHIEGRCVLGYKLLLCAFFDGKTTDSWFTCVQLMACVRSIGKGAMHFVGLAKMGKTKYTVSEYVNCRKGFHLCVRLKALLICRQYEVISCQTAYHLYIKKSPAII